MQTSKHWYQTSKTYSQIWDAPSHTVIYEDMVGKKTSERDLLCRKTRDVCTSSDCGQALCICHIEADV